MTLARHPSTATLVTHQDITLPFLINGFDAGIPIHFHQDSREQFVDEALQCLSDAVSYQYPHKGAIKLIGMKP
ncbi:hypothetical protein ACEN88_36215, partial [Massilia sp. CT11-108]|uniref:hypothetical protein n=1 Tax=Massilia sp. CT11-108 TaxID=3393900 RepID=UPI0039A51774